MSMIPDEIIEQVRDSADMVGLIGDSVELKRTGSDYRGPCPFHGGTHRNFAVIPKKGQFYCFVCKESGDIFSWYMKRFGMDYPTAVREVAGRTGIVIPEQAERSGPDPREPLYSAMSAAQGWFSRQLTEHPEAEAARAYLVQRQFDLEALAPFELGFAPRGNLFLTEMSRLGLREPILLEAGLLAKRDDGTLVPKFRGRLLFPIHDLRGRVVAFGGRLLGPGEPKYLNSPETPIFHKGGQLYNLHQARQAIRKEQEVIVVEGYFDVIRLVLAGLDHVVAPLGTALTSDQAALVRRLAPVATLLLDSDSAGLKATFRAGDELLRHEMRVRVATMPEGEDPDTLVARGGIAALQPILKDAIDVLERKIQILHRRGWFDGFEHRREALDRLLPTIRAARDPITRELYLSIVAERSGVDKKVLEREVAALPISPPESSAGPSVTANAASALAPQRRAAAPSARRVGARAEQQLMRVVVNDHDWRDRALAEVPAEWLEGAEYHEIFEAYRVTGAGAEVDLEKLSPEARRVWAGLKAAADGLEGQDLGMIYEGARRALEARPHFRELEALNDRILIARPDEQRALTEEKDRRVRDLRARFPAEFELHGWRRLRIRHPEGRTRS